jgi:Short C-terminal domain
MMRRRRGPGIVGMAVGTAVVAGTAGAVRHRQETKYANQAAEQQAAQQDIYNQGVADAQAQAAPPPAAAPAPAAGGGDDTMAKLQQLADLHTSGVLTDEEFAQAKAKLLA